MAVTGNLSGDLDINDELHVKDNLDQQQRESREGVIVEVDAKFVPLPENETVSWLSPFKNDGLDKVQQEQRKKKKYTDKQELILVGNVDIPFETKTQVFAIHGMKMLQAGIVQLSGNNKAMCMNSMLSAHHTLRIVAGVSKNRHEVCVVSEHAKRVLKTDGSITALLGKDS
ncbi:MAG: hypothetical protein EZS28_044625 [Streblomastix strix]|uniref:Uncharacterized protein n=1 Tax=Streblomastix strix TaxID=222440 RepID=A0A5J4TPC5_9EUKA|nr:MAG: hypothetical protein EZS28_044625 [Streblomastix strix]